MLPNPPGGLVPGTALIHVTFDIPVSYFSLVRNILRLYSATKIFPMTEKRPLEMPLFS